MTQFWSAFNKEDEKEMNKREREKKKGITQCAICCKKGEVKGDRELSTSSEKGIDYFKNCLF